MILPFSIDEINPMVSTTSCLAFVGKVAQFEFSVLLFGHFPWLDVQDIPSGRNIQPEIPP